MHILASVYFTVSVKAERTSGWSPPSPDLYFDFLGFLGLPGPTFPTTVPLIPTMMALGPLPEYTSTFPCSFKTSFRFLLCVCLTWVTRFVLLM